VLTPVDRAIRGRIARHGPVPYADVVAAALYDPEHGFYAGGGGRAGRGGDFLTSPEVGPLFGAVVARALDGWWRQAGAPPVFVVVEAGAGPGTLAQAVLAAEPECAAALRYVLVETAASQRAHQVERLALEDPAAAFAVLPDPDDAVTVPPPPGPVVVSLPELPRLPGPCVVLANELLDNLPFGVLERTAEGWAEVRVGLPGRAGHDDDDTEGHLVEVLVPSTEAPAVDAPVGARLPVHDAATDWLRDARALAGPEGRVVMLDYAATSAELVTRPWTEWVRTYRSHVRGGPSLVELGTQDITVEVCTDRLGAEPGSDVSQADWLRAHGIDELVGEGRRIWDERAHLGDLAAVRARSRIREAEALTDPSGLGAFRVLEWPGT